MSLKHGLHNNMSENLDGLVYTHLPKCGGNSIVSFIRSLAAVNNLNLLSFSGSCSANSIFSRINNMLRGATFGLEEIDIYVGHLPFSITQKLFPNLYFTVSLRDPVDQYISSYCSQPENKAKQDFGMRSFCEMVVEQKNHEWAIDNIQTRMLCDNPKFGDPVNSTMLETAKSNLAEKYQVVGFLDNLNGFTAALSNIFGDTQGTIPSGQLNQTGNYEEFISTEHLACAASANQYDVSLFTWAKTHFADKAKEPQIMLEKNRSKRLQTIYNDDYLVNF